MPYTREQFKELEKQSDMIMEESDARLLEFFKENLDTAYSLEEVCAIMKDIDRDKFLGFIIRSGLIGSLIIDGQAYYMYYTATEKGSVI